MFREPPSKYNKNMLQREMEEKFKKNATAVYFALYDYCINLEKKANSLTLRKPLKKIACCNLSPEFIFASLMIFTNLILGVLAVLVKNNPIFYSNGQTRYQYSEQVCHKPPHGGGIPFWGSLSNMLTLPVCHTETKEVNALNYFEYLFIIILFFNSMVFTTTALSTPTYISDIKESINYFIEILEALSSEDELKNIIFEKAIDIDEIISKLKMLEYAETNHSIDHIKNQLTSIINKIKSHLISQDQQGYFSNHLTDKEVKERKERHAYVNVNIVDENILIENQNRFSH